MSQLQFKVSPSVLQHIARAKASLKRGDALKAVHSLMSSLELFEPKKVIGKAKYETEIFIMEVVEDLNRNSLVQEFLAKMDAAGNIPQIPYSPGMENQLYAALRVLSKALRDDAEATEIVQAEKSDARREQLWSKGTELLSAGEAPRGKAILRRLAEEFGDEESVKTNIGKVLMEAELAPEAIEFLEEAIEQFPNDHVAYGLLVRAYTELRYFEKAEKVYVAVLKRFGQHYKTLLNFANLYKLWNKRDMAYDMAKMALREKPGNAEAQEIMEWADRRR